MMKTIGEFSFLSFQMICLLFRSIKSILLWGLNAQDEQVSKYFHVWTDWFYSRLICRRPSNKFLPSDGSYHSKKTKTNGHPRFTSESKCVTDYSLGLHHHLALNRSTNSIAARQPSIDYGIRWVFLISRWRWRPREQSVTHFDSEVNRGCPLVFVFFEWLRSHQVIEL